LPSNSVDLILTSPPYLTAQKYVRTHKLESLWLGMVSEQELLELDKKTIGSERVSLNEVNFTEGIGTKSVDDLVRWASLISRERAAMLFNYFSKMKQAFSEMFRVLKDGGYVIIVIGNNKVLGRDVETYRLLTDVAVQSRFSLQVALRDKIRWRGMITRRHNTGGLIEEEFILVLKKEE